MLPSRCTPPGRPPSPPPDVQRQAFAWHIDLAKRTGKPLMIHNRDADADVLDVLRAEGAPETVIFHCFSSGCAMPGLVRRRAGLPAPGRHRAARNLSF